MTKMVYLVQHLQIMPEVEDIKTIGVYSSHEKALAAIARISKQPGFVDHPNIINPIEDEEENGFYVTKYIIDEDQWADGFFIS